MILVCKEERLACKLGSEDSGETKPIATPWVCGFPASRLWENNFLLFKHSVSSAFYCSSPSKLSNTVGKIRWQESGGLIWFWLKCLNAATFTKIYESRFCFHLGCKRMKENIDLNLATGEIYIIEILTTSLSISESEIGRQSDGLNSRVIRSFHKIQTQELFHLW